MKGRSKLDTGPQKNQKIGNWRKGVLTFYTKQPGGNVLHKHKTVKSDVVEERPATCTMYIQISYADLEKLHQSRYSEIVRDSHSRLNGS